MLAIAWKPGDSSHGAQVAVAERPLGGIAVQSAGDRLGSVPHGLDRYLRETGQVV
jgi:hypothetical protein